MTTHKKKDFDCIEIKRDAQSKIYEAIKQMTPEEEIAYFRKSVDNSKLSKWWKSVPSRVELSKTQ
ncbi:MAG: hypothetical protein HY707_13520 [Ignavibacteriae bacterium]|nr:hypothetical protein [Ignavibacteriota bacterium]